MRAALSSGPCPAAPHIRTAHLQLTSSIFILSDLTLATFVNADLTLVKFEESERDICPRCARDAPEVHLSTCINTVNHP